LGTRNDAKENRDELKDMFVWRVGTQNTKREENWWQRTKRDA